MKLLFDNLELFLRLAALAQLGDAILNLFLIRLAVFIATTGMVILIVLVARANPAMLTDPCGAPIEDLCLIACAFTVWRPSPGHPRRRLAAI